MNWLVGASVSATVKATDWSPWLMILNQMSHWVLALSYLLMSARFLIIQNRRKKSARILKPIRQILIVCLLGLLMHFSNMFAGSRQNDVLFTYLSLLGAATVSMAMFMLPGAVESLASEQFLGDLESMNVEVGQQGSENAKVEQERYERLRARVHLLEDNFQRSSWIAQSRSAMNQLTDLLADLESIVGARQGKIGEKKA